MAPKPETPESYLQSLPEDRKAVVEKLRSTILENLPKGFSEQIAYGMLAYVVPHSLYPAGYHTDPKQPLPFISLASQKNYISLYHICLYSDPKLLDWFTKEYAKVSKTKLDMGKSCIRFKNPDQIPFKLIGELASKITPQDWILRYESRL